MRSSREAVDLIVKHEVSSRATYEKKYKRPEWPGVASGITVGIGYDLGYNSASTILSDWKDYLTPDVVREMQRYAGVTGSGARAVLANARQSISVPWDAAMAVFLKVSLPKFEALVVRACPGAENLPPGCFGVLTSIAYNRGASFTKAGERYREMRNIRTHIATNRWDQVPDEIRSMKRLWSSPPVNGLLRRRDEEAALWEKSLIGSRAPLMPAPPSRIDTGDEKEPLDNVAPIEVTSGVTPVERPINVQPSTVAYSMEVELIQRTLIAMKYYEVGEPDGKAGGKFVAGIAAFMTDRGRDPNQGRITPELKEELSRAKSEFLPNGEPWSRPIAPSRANATAKDIAPKVASVGTVWYQKLFAYILGIPSMIAAGFNGLFGEQYSPAGYISSIREFFGAIPAEFYWLGVAGLAAAIFIMAKKTQDRTVKDYREGKIN